MRRRHIIELLNSEYLKFSQQRNVEHNKFTVENYVQELVLSGGWYFLIILDKRVVGSLTIRKVQTRIYNIGIMVYQSNNNSQVATLAIRYAIDMLDSIGVSEVQIGTHIANMAMRRVIEKLGFEIVVGPSNVSNKDKIYFRKLLLQK